MCPIFVKGSDADTTPTVVKVELRRAVDPASCPVRRRRPRKFLADAVTPVAGAALSK
jgi:hypothetical protein